MKTDDIEAKVCERLRSLYGEAAAPLIADIEQRQAFGLAKYGVRLKDNPAPLAARLRHMLEELLDAAVYAGWIADAYQHDVMNCEAYRGMQEKLLRIAMRIRKRSEHLPATDDGEEVWP